MAIYPIRTFGDPVLRQQAVDVTEFDEHLDRLVEDMLETMYDAPGVGLAAPQIGISKRVFVYDVGEGPGAIINPEVTETDGEWEFDEGCLSVPGHFWPITRASYAKVTGVDLESNELVLEGDELMGRMLLHEVDHLNGTLLLKRLDDDLRKEYMKEWRQAQLQEASAVDGAAKGSAESSGGQ